MGIDAPTARYLMVCRAAGVPFARVITLGRQSMHVDSLQMRASARALDLKWKDDDIRGALAEPNRRCEPFFQMLGAESVDSLDASDYEGATKAADLNQPIPEGLEGQFDFVFDGGTLEHVFHFPNAIENVMKLLAPGGSFLTVTVANNFCGHGFYQFSPELFFRVFTRDRGFKCLGAYLYEESRSPDYSWMEIADPADVQSRILLKNTRETYIAFHAQRVGPIEAWSDWPQQSDYSVAWQDGSQAIVGNPLPTGAKAFRRRLRSSWHRLSSPLRTPLEALKLGVGNRGFDPRHYQPVQLDSRLVDELARRQRA